MINLLSYNIDGIILSEKYHTLRTVKFLRSANIPVVELMDIQGDRLDMEVGFDNRQAAFDMVSTMLDKRQRRKILYLGSKDDVRDEQRYRGYCDAMTRRGLVPLRVNPRSISSIHLGTQMMRDALAAHPDLDGVFAPTTILRWARCCCAASAIWPFRNRSQLPVFTGWKWAGR